MPGNRNFITLNELIMQLSNEEFIDLVLDVFRDIIQNDQIEEQNKLLVLSQTTPMTVHSSNSPIIIPNTTETVIAFYDSYAIKLHFQQIFDEWNEIKMRMDIMQNESLVIKKKRTFNEMNDLTPNMLFSCNYFYPLSKRRKFEYLFMHNSSFNMKNSSFNANVILRFHEHRNSLITDHFKKQMQYENETMQMQERSGIKSIQNDISDILDYETVIDRQYINENKEVIQMLSAPTSKDLLINDLYSSKNRKAVHEFCKFGTKHLCNKHMQMMYQQNPMNNMQYVSNCPKIHFIRILRPHSMPPLGDCSYLDGCRHMDTCRFMHYIIDENCVARKRPHFKARSFLNELQVKQSTSMNISTIVQPNVNSSNADAILNSSSIFCTAEKYIHRYDAQWINCDIRHLDFSVLSKYGVIMADPPWDIHMELPYGTLTDDEMLGLNIKQLADENCLLFMWVTGRVMETARRCMNCWGFECSEEIVWIKTNQLQRIIRTGRTGHWLNHSKEHCLVGIKEGGKAGRMLERNRNEKWNTHLDCDVIVAEVRETSRKPDEIYSIMERLSPGTQKIEIFGRQHNCRAGWITLGNQLNGTRILDPEIRGKFKKLYPTIKVKET